MEAGEIMPKSVKFKKNIFLDSSSVVHNQQGLEFKFNLFKTHQMYNARTGENGWCRIARVPSSGGYAQRNLTLLLTSSIGSDNGFGMIYFSWYNNGSTIAKVLFGNINTNYLFAIKNSDNTFDIWFYLNAYYRPLHVQIVSIYNGGGEPWDVFENTGWIQAAEPSGNKYYFSYI